MRVGDIPKSITAEDLIRRFRLLEQDVVAIKSLNNGLTKVENELNNYVDKITRDIESLQDQVDGNITTWFYNGVPTLNNLPASEWTKDADKNNHLGDLYYDSNTGYAYRFALTNNVYSWEKLTDSDVTQALAIANAAQDTADSKRRVFVTEPVPPYDVGDVWIKDDQDLYRCRASRNAGSYSSSDWIIATKYTDDTYALSVKAVLDDFKTEVQTNYVTSTTLETTESSINANVTSKLDKYATTDDVTSQISSVTSRLTSSEAKITTINETLENGVSKVKTENDYTFNKDGLDITSSNTNIHNTLNENGMTIRDKNETLLFAGYDEDTKESLVLARNIKVEKYLTSPYERKEAYNNPDHGWGSGAFDI